VEAVAAFVAWAGAATIVVADARRGQAAGIGLVGIGLAVACLPRAGWAGAALIAAGAAAAAARRYAVGLPGWRVMPPGSTPRLVLSVAAGLVTLWVAVVVMSGPAGALRFASLVVLALSGGRLLSSDDPYVAQTAVAAIALAVAAAAALASDPTAIWPYLAGAMVAVAAVWLPYRAPHAA